MADDFIPQFVSRLRDRLEELEQDKARLISALRILEDKANKPDGLPIGQVLLDRITTFPGSRASLLGLELGLSPGVITRQLHVLEAEQLIVRSGLGWEAASGGKSRSMPPKNSR